MTAAFKVEQQKSIDLFTQITFVENVLKLMRAEGVSDEDIAKMTTFSTYLKKLTEPAEMADVRSHRVLDILAKYLDSELKLEAIFPEGPFGPVKARVGDFKNPSF